MGLWGGHKNMQLHGNTVLITGGTSGIGRGLAEAFHQRGNQVIIAGRREERLREMCRPASGDAQLRTRRHGLTGNPIRCGQGHRGVPCPELRLQQRRRSDAAGFSPSGSLDDQALQTEINTNLLGPIRMMAAYIPHLATRPGATLVNVSSGLAFVPMARFPIYCATKAAVHTWTLALRHQLRALRSKGN